MDIVTHGLAGGLVAHAATKHGARPPRLITAAAVVGALAPDLDALAGLWDPMAPVTVHRTVTHSLIGAIPLALVLAGALRTCGSRVPLWRLALFAYLGVLSHIGLDLLTPFGTAVFWPLDSRRVGLGWLYVIDPLVSAIVVAGLLLAAARGRHPTRVARGALAVLVVNALVAGAMVRTAERQYTRLLAARGVAATRMVLVPVFPGPVRWLGVAETDRAIYRSRFWIGGRSGEPVMAFPKPGSDGDPALEQRPEVQAFLSFARVPWRTVRTDGDDRIVEYQDLAFEDHPGGGPMTLRLTVDPSGIVRAVGLGHRF